MNSSKIAAGLTFLAAAFAVSVAPSNAAAVQTAKLQVLNNTSGYDAVSIAPNNWLAPLTFTAYPNSASTYDVGLQLPVGITASFSDLNTGTFHRCAARVHQSKLAPCITVVNSDTGCAISVR